MDTLWISQRIYLRNDGIFRQWESHVVMKKNEKNPYVPTLNNARGINEKSKILPQYASYNSLCVGY